MINIAEVLLTYQGLAETARFANPCDENDSVQWSRIIVILRAAVVDGMVQYNYLLVQCVQI